MSKIVDTIKHLRTTGRGSDRYGACEVCGKSVSEMFVFEHRNLVQRDDGSIFSHPTTGGTYGHRDCLVQSFGQPNISQH